MRIGIFGGTFDPIHNCHLRIARQTCRRMRLDRVYFVPSGVPPHKPARAVQAPKDRLEMVRLAILREPRFFLSDLEVYRTGKSYAVETIESFARKFPRAELYFILGIDAFVEIRHWRQANRLFSLCHFVVLSRHGYSFKALEGIFKGLPVAVRIDRAFLSRMDRVGDRKNEIPLKNGCSLFLLKIPPCRISATEVRSRLSARQDMKNLLPGRVKSFILKKGLYRESEGA